MRYFFILIFFVSAFTRAEEKKITIITNDSVPVSPQSLSKQQLKDIYLLKKRTWQDNSQIIVVNRKSGDSQRVLFEKRLGLSSKKYASYLARMHYKGAILPIIQQSEKAMLEFVENVPGAIGYVEEIIPNGEKQTIK
jgi:ABC-type phosphate transport system substrate-binding protein